MKKLLVWALVLCLFLSGCTGGEPISSQNTMVTTASVETTAPAPTASAQAREALDGKNILFIGNSYTFFGSTVNYKNTTVLTQAERSNDKGLFYQLCKENGIQVSVTNWTFSGHDLTDTMSQMCKRGSTDCDGQNHMSYLEDPVFDYVAIQLFYEREYTGDLVSHLKPTMDFFREANPDVKFLLLVPHMTYVRRFQWRDHIQPLAEAGVTVCNWGAMLDDIVNGTVEVPGGTQKYFRGTFVVSKTEDDGHHQNLLAGYLTALMTYCAITGDSAVGQPYGFADDPSIHPNFDMEAFRKNNYIIEPFTNFVEVYRSPEDMLGLQQLTDQYIAKYNAAN